MDGGLPPVRSVLAVCAHPDDESFGLGAVLHAFADAGATLSLLCFTHGEASTLHTGAGELGPIRAAELEAASGRLGVGRVVLLDYPDGRLRDEPRPALAGHVLRTAREVGADALLVFDEGGITGHPDHQAATDAARDAAGPLGVPVLAWAIPVAVATALNAEFGTAFVGRSRRECAIVLERVDRSAQREAIECHASQATDNPVLRRRLELQQDTEWLRTL
jgi:LmbE family N-acetylglucosaminyl deacetylase